MEAELNRAQLVAVIRSTFGLEKSRGNTVASEVVPDRIVAGHRIYDQSTVEAFIDAYRVRARRKDTR